MPQAKTRTKRRLCPIILASRQSAQSMNRCAISFFVEPINCSRNWRIGLWDMFQIISKIQLFPFWQDTQETMWFQQRTQTSREDAEYMAPEQNAEVWVTVQSSRKFWNYGNILSHPCSCFKQNKMPLVGSSHHHKKIRFISSFHIFSFSHHHSQPSIPGAAAASASSSIFLAFSTAWSASCSCSCAVTWWKLFMRQKYMCICIYM